MTTIRQKNNTYKFIDLFAGIGGFRVALERRGLECVFSSEIDEHAMDVYERNFGERPHGDITQIKARDIPDHDILCGGFPCQSFSISGKRGGLMSNRLFYEIVRVAEYHKPRILLLENVENILNVDNRRTIETIERKLDEIGYKTHRSLLNASHYGIPQSRKRVYFVCLRKDIALDYEMPKPNYKRIYLKDILEDVVDETLFIKRDDIVIEGGEVGYELQPVRVGYLNKGGQGERIYSPLGHAITLSANGGGAGARTGLYHVNGRVRKLSIMECKRLMGFPDDHVVGVGIQGYKQLGNAVIPAMVSAVYDRIRSCDE